MTIKQLKKIRAEVEMLTIDDEHLGSNGWLDRDGMFYPCEYATHADLADKITYAARISGRDPQQELEARGWMKISAGSCYFFAFKAADRKWLEFTKPSKAQDDFVMLFLSKRQDKKQLEDWLSARERDRDLNWG